MVIMRPLLPEVIVSKIAPGPGLSDLNSVSVYPVGPLLAPKSVRHSKRMAMFALRPAVSTVLATLVMPDLSRPLALATPLAVATLAFAPLLVSLMGATYNTTV